MKAFISLLSRGTVDAEIKATCVENLELSNILSFKPGVGQILSFN